MTARRPDIAFHVAWLLIALATLLAAMFLQVEQGTQVVIPFLNQPLPETCVTRAWLGRPCPGCGLTRSFISLADGDIRAAWHYNPAGLYLAALFLLQIPYRAVQVWRIRTGRSELQLGRLGAVAALLVPVLLLVQWFERLRLG